MDLEEEKNLQLDTKSSDFLYDSRYTKLPVFLKFDIMAVIEKQQFVMYCITLNSDKGDSPQLCYFMLHILLHLLDCSIDRVWKIFKRVKYKNVSTKSSWKWWKF